MRTRLVLAAVGALAAAVILPGAAAAGQCLGDLAEWQVSPAATDPAIDHALDDHYVYVHPDLPLQDELVVWFPGSCGRPERYRRLLREAALQGFRTIGLAYSNCPSVTGVCSTLEPSNPDCLEEVRRERLDGLNHSAAIALDTVPANSIENRLVKLLLHLDTVDPGRGWASFVDGGTPRWEDMVLAGHSQGGGYGPLVALDHQVGRVVSFAGTDRYAGAPAPWTQEPHVTPADRYFMVGHVQDNLPAKLSVWDAYGVPGGLVVFEATPEPFGGGHRIITNLDPSTGDPGDVHGSIAGDSVTPVAEDGETPLLAPAWRYVFGGSAETVIHVPADLLKLVDGVVAVKPKKKSFKFKSATKKDPVEHRIVLPVAGSSGDPTLHGARLEVMNAFGSGELADAFLPASGWTRLGPAPVTKGYRYRGEPDDAITKVVLKEDKVTVRARGEAWCYSLDEPTQQTMGVRIRFGDGLELCAVADARESGNPPSTANHDRVDLFRGVKDAPPPEFCPLSPRPAL